MPPRKPASSRSWEWRPTSPRAACTIGIPSSTAAPFISCSWPRIETGYRNLLQIASAAQLEGFYYRPRIDHDYLAAHSEGLIVSTGCMSGEIPRALVDGRTEHAQRLVDWYFEVFGPERFFFELQSHDVSELTAVNRGLMDLSRRYPAHFIATNDVHYVNPEDAELQDILLCIQTGSLRADPDRMRMTDPSYYLRTPDEMRALFAEVPEALSNTLLIAERCHVDLDFKGYHLPKFDVPEGQTTDSYLRALCEDGLRVRYGEQASRAEVRQRLDYELGVIHTMGFDTYFLIVWDLCRFAREQGIWYNARGSANGSIVAYCLGITLVDPLEHGLIFERFLNPAACRCRTSTWISRTTCGHACWSMPPSATAGTRWPRSSPSERWVRAPRCAMSDA